MKTRQYIVKTFHGLEELVYKELKGIGAKDIRILKRAVSFRGTQEVLYKANYWLRTGIAILQPIHEFKATNEDELYEGAKKFKWTDMMGMSETFSVHATVYSPHFNHSQFVGLKVKDAIADQFREQIGGRPNVDPKNADYRISVHIATNKVTISLDSSGDPLFKRGYRVDQWKAPINEVLAAGILELAGYNGTRPLLDPMCGSGTFLFEGAMIASNIPSGAKRKQFGFMNWLDFDKNLWQQIQDEAIEHRKLMTTKAVGIDIAGGAINAANKNLENFSAKRNVQFYRNDFLHFAPKEDNGLLIINPPYDKRIGHMKIDEFYGEIGRRLKHAYAGWDAWIISTNADAMKNIGLKPSKKITLFNGPLECQLCHYELFSGKHKEYKKRKFEK